MDVWHCCVAWTISLSKGLALDMDVSVLAVLFGVVCSASTVDDAAAHVFGLIVGKACILYWVFALNPILHIHINKWLLNIGDNKGRGKGRQVKIAVSSSGPVSHSPAMSILCFFARFGHGCCSWVLGKFIQLSVGRNHGGKCWKGNCF